MSTYYSPVPIGQCIGIIANIGGGNFQCMTQEQWKEYHSSDSTVAAIGAILVIALTIVIAAHIVKINN